MKRILSAFGAFVVVYALLVSVFIRSALNERRDETWTN